VRSGTASLLLLFVLARELSRKTRSSAKYDGAWMEIADDDDGNVPVNGLATRMGFKPAYHKDAKKKKEEAVYLVLHHDDEDTVPEALAAALPDLGRAKEMCSVEPRSGYPRCK
jgi:hypothetical protein